MAISVTPIHDALQQVAALQAVQKDNLELLAATKEVKLFQARRFQASYADLARIPRYQPAIRFFLLELYSDKDFGARDQQFARIANTIARIFPQSVVQTTTTLAKVHALTEHLDHEMALHWLASRASHPALDEAHRYTHCWRATGEADSRFQQLALVQQLGQDLAQLTRKPGLRSLLKMMRTPARAANLGTLQDFLEAGFDAFAHIRGADELLLQIEQRESHWINALFSQEPDTSATQLQLLLDTVDRR